MIPVQHGARPVLGLDRAGTLCSTLCAIHCLAMALFPSILVGLGLSFMAGPAAEWGFTIAAMLLASIALVTGLRRHRSMPVAIAFALGIIGLAGSRVLESIEMGSLGTSLGVCAALALITGHMLNLRLTKAHGSKLHAQIPHPPGRQQDR